VSSGFNLSINATIPAALSFGSRGAFGTAPPRVPMSVRIHPGSTAITIASSVSSRPRSSAAAQTVIMFSAAFVVRYTTSCVVAELAPSPPMTRAMLPMRPETFTTTASRARRGRTASSTRVAPITFTSKERVHAS